MLKLTSVKIIHTIIWCFFNVVLFFLFYSVITNNIGMLVWVGISIIVIEGMVLLVFGKKCPLTIIARRYSNSSKDNFDIYLPNWLARWNKLIYTIFFFLIICILIYRLANR